MSEAAAGPRRAAEISARVPKARRFALEIASPAAGTTTAR